MRDWFKPRRYRHFDRPVREEFTAKAQQPEFVAQHPFSPLIKYVKVERRYRKSEHRTIGKDRTIMFASHRESDTAKRPLASPCHASLSEATTFM